MRASRVAIYITGTALVAGLGAGTIAIGTDDSSDAAPPASAATTTAEATTTTDAPSTSTTTTRPPDPSVTLAFGGDVHFEGVLRGKLAADPTTVLAPIAPVLQAADLAMVNLESAITEGGSPQPKAYTFRASPAAFTALRSAGIDVVTMANNHGVDFGPVGLRDSLAAIAVSMFPVVGIGADEQHAYAPYRTRIKGLRIAVLGASQVIDDPFIATWSAGPTQAGIASAKRADRLVRAVRDARRGSDVVVVFLHWGREGSACPTPEQRLLAGQLADAGADAIVGSHAHLLLGAGYLRHTFVDYGLGNFAFSSPPGPHSDTGVLQLTVKRHRVVRYAWTPAAIRGGVPIPLTGPAAPAAVAQWQAHRSCTDLTP